MRSLMLAVRCKIEPRLRSENLSQRARGSFRRSLGTWALALASAAFSVSTAHAERPTAPQLFPTETFGYIRVDDSRDLKAKMGETATGRLGSDPEIKPILDEIYGSAVSLTNQMQEALGVNLDELLSIPNGELAVAVFPGENDPAVAVMLEAGDELPALKLIIGRAETALEERGSVRSEEVIGELTLVTWQDEERAERQVSYFIDQGVFVLCSQKGKARKLTEIWQGMLGEGKEKHKPLAENRRFLTIMGQSAGTEGERPQISFFIDPLAGAKQIARNAPGSTAVFAILPALGVDGLQAVGGSLILATKEFDSISHFHVLLESPRRGLMEVIRPKSGSTIPEAWIPESVASYSTINWDVPKTLSSVEEIFNTFRGEDAFQTEFFDRGSKEVGFDIREEIVGQIAGRFTLLQGFTKPFRLNSGTNLYAIQLKDPDRFKEKVLRTVKERVERDGRITFTRKSGTEGEFYTQNPREGQASSDVIRQPRVCFGVLEDYLIISDDEYMINEVLAAKRGDRGLLADAVDYKLIVEKVKSQLGDKKTSILFFQRPEESLQVFYEMARDPNNQSRLKDMGEGNPVFAALSKVLEKHQLPPFSVVQKYLSPSGAFVTEDETGIHYTAFSLKRE